MTEMHMHPTLHCDNGMEVRPGFRFEEFDLPIDPQTGRFVWRFSGGGSDTTLKGTVHKHVITGHLRTGYATSVGVNPRRCISGRKGDRWIYFAARRQAPASDSRKPHVACWNTYFPFEPEGPDLLKRPSRCLIYKAGAQRYAEGAVAAKRLRWHWGDRKARARGLLDEPATDPGNFKRGRLTLWKPVVDCGTRVFSRVRYSFRKHGERVSKRYRIYTC